MWGCFCSSVANLIWLLCLARWAVADAHCNVTLPVISLILIYKLSFCNLSFYRQNSMHKILSHRAGNTPSPSSQFVLYKSLYPCCKHTSYISHLSRICDPKEIVTMHMHVSYFHLTCIMQVCISTQFRKAPQYIKFVGRLWGILTMWTPYLYLSAGGCALNFFIL